MAAIDRIVGTAAANALLAGLLAKARTGTGRKIRCRCLRRWCNRALRAVQGATFDPPTSAPGLPEPCRASRRAVRDQRSSSLADTLPYNDGQIAAKILRVVEQGAHSGRGSQLSRAWRTRAMSIDALYDMIADKLKARPTAEESLKIFFMTPTSPTWCRIRWNDAGRTAPEGSWLLPVQRSCVIRRQDPDHGRNQRSLGNSALGRSL